MLTILGTGKASPGHLLSGVNGLPHRLSTRIRGRGTHGRKSLGGEVARLSGVVRAVEENRRLAGPVSPTGRPDVPDSVFCRADRCGRNPRGLLCRLDPKPVCEGAVADDGIGAILSMARRTGRLWRCSAGEGAPGRRPDCSAISETRVCVPKARLEAGDRASSARAIKNRNTESRKARLLNRLFRRDSRWRRVRLRNLAIRAPCAHIHRGSGLLSSELWNLERHGASCVRTRRCRRNRAKALRVDILRIGSYFRIGNRDVRPLSRFSPER